MMSNIGDSSEDFNYEAFSDESFRVKAYIVDRILKFALKVLYWLSPIIMTLISQA